jgi:peptidoglycan/xylan/chitin deacetylase (PgdA/CDA1 family)
LEEKWKKIDNLTYFHSKGTGNLNNTMIYKKKKRFFVISTVCVLSYCFITTTSLELYQSDSLQQNSRIQPATFLKENIKVTNLPEKKSGIKAMHKSLVTLPNKEAQITTNPSVDMNTTDKENIVATDVGNVVTDPLPVEVPANKIVYLTFDDGPKNISDNILTILDQYQAKATFFMIDRNIRSYPDVIKRMVASGHAVGSHGVSHNTNMFYQSSQTVIAEMAQTRNTILEITGIDSSLIRTPYGSAPKMTDDYKKAVTDNGFIMWDWNIDSKDWYFRDHRYVETVIAQIENKKNQSAPIVILLHEQEETAAQLPELLNYLTSQQYVLQALDPSVPPVQF